MSYVTWRLDHLETIIEQLENRLADNPSSITQKIAGDSYLGVEDIKLTIGYNGEVTPDVSRIDRIFVSLKGHDSLIDRPKWWQFKKRKRFDAAMKKFNNIARQTCHDRAELLLLEAFPGLIEKHLK